MYTFIINPHARSGQGARVWEELEALLLKEDVPYRAFFTRYQHHATALARELTSDKNEHTIIVLGGDGTINETVNGIADLSRTVLGYIPIGSSNDFARGLSLPSDPSEALRLILSRAHTLPINIGILSYKNRKRRFAVSAGIGFDAAVCHQAVVSRLKVLLNRLHLGKLTYAGIALNRMLFLKPSGLCLSLDGRKPLFFPQVYFAAAMNTCCEGGGFRFCPDAHPDDDLLNIIVVSGIPKWKALLLLPLAFCGLHTRFRGIHLFSCRTARFESDRPLPVHTDGEPVYLQRALTVSLEESRLSILSKEGSKKEMNFIKKP